MFRTVPLSIIRSFSLYTQQWYMSYSLRTGSGRNQFRPDPARKLSANADGTSSVLILLASCMTYTTAVCTVRTPDDGQRNCPKYAEFYSKNKFEKLMRLVGLLIRIYHDAARSTERQIIKFC